MRRPRLRGPGVLNQPWRGARPFFGGLYKPGGCAILTLGKTDWVLRGGVRVGWLFLLPLLSGCLQTRMTEPPRTAVEQLLLSAAADRSLQRIHWEIFEEKKVFVDTNYFESYDRAYVLGTVRDLLSAYGALLATNANEADIIVEPRSGALSTDSASSLVGMPSLPVPIPLAGTFTTPEMYLWKSEKMFSTAKIALLAYDQKTRRHVYSSGPLAGRASHKYYKFLGYFSVTRTDIPEKK